MDKTKHGNRRLIQIGGSLGITIPKYHLERMGWKAGDKISYVVNDVLVYIRPVSIKENELPKGVNKTENEMAY